MAVNAAPQGGGPPPTDTITLDISPAGLLLVRPEAMRVWPRYEITLSGGDLDAPIVTDATPSRVLPDSIGMRFTTLGPADSRTLTLLVATHFAGARRQPRP